MKLGICFCFVFLLLLLKFAFFGKKKCNSNNKLCQHNEVKNLNNFNVYILLQITQITQIWQIVFSGISAMHNVAAAIQK